MKKTLFITVCAMILMFCSSLGVSAAEPWNGTTQDTDWYTNAPSGTTSFDISTTAQLAGLAKLVNAGTDNFAGKTITLTADLDLGGVYSNGAWDATNSKNWTPIGTWKSLGNSVNNIFSGTFDGNGKTISNLYISGSASYQGLFGNVASTGKIKNLTISSGYVYSVERSAGIAGCNAGVILNCKNAASVSTVGGYDAGVAGYNIGNIAYCQNAGNVTSTSYSIGGIAGINTGSVIFSVNSGNVSSSNVRIGGVVGENSGMINNDYNAGTVASSSTSTSAYVGGIVGKNNKGTVQNAYSTGAVAGIPPASGGALGGSIAGTVNNLYYLKTATINSLYYSVGSTTAVTADAANTYAKDDTSLKADETVSALGSAFAKDANHINNVYPVLSWQVNGYPEDECNTLAIDNVTAVNGTITVTMNKALAYTILSANDFTVTATSNGNDITLGSPVYTQTNGDNATTVTITFTAIEAASSKQTIHVAVSYKGAEAKTADYTIGLSNQWFAYAANGFEGGSGTMNDPYQVKTAAQLAYLSAQVKAGNNFSGCYFSQIADIDLGSSIDSNGTLVGYNWTPIGYTGTATFNGNYNGNGNKVTGLACVQNTSPSGLFGTTNMARILNVNVVCPALNIASNAGGIVGIATDTSLKNCHVIGGTLSTSGYTAGGLVATANSSVTDADNAMEISGCSSTASVCGRVAGGLIGYCTYGTIRNSQPTPNGYIFINDCYVTGSVRSNTSTANGNIGGFVGGIGVINTVHSDHCYASGNLTSKDKNSVGGLVGFVQVTGSSRVTDVKVTNSAALNHTINYSGSGQVSNYARIMGNGAAGVLSGYVTLKNNHALDTLMINGNMIDCTDESSADGASMTKEDFAVQSTWQGFGFDLTDSGAWLWNADKYLPDLRNTTADYAIQIISNPHDATSYINKDAIFQIKAKNGVGAFSYQWQNSKDSKAWNNITDATDTVLKVPYDTTLNGYQYRCVVTDTAGQTATSTAATLTVKSKKYTADIAASSLYKVYQGKETLNTVREPISLYAYKQNVSDFTNSLRYYGNYYISGTSTSMKPKGNLSWTMLDAIAFGQNPRQYVKQGDNTEAKTFDLVAEILGNQGENGALVKVADAYSNDTDFDNIIYMLDLETYFGGAKTWGNEKDGTAYGRDGALKYLFSQVKDDSESDGQYFYTLTPFNIISTADIQRNQADFVILMARLVNNDTYDNQAKDAMYGVMEYLDYQYDNNQITSTETMGRYLSALVAAANATTNHLKQDMYYSYADKVYASLQTALALDGTYAAAMNYTTPPATGDAAATAAVMMGLSDYVNDNCALVTLEFKISDEDVLNTDFGTVSVPSTTTSNLTLPTKGAYGTVFTWESSAPKVIATNGTVTRATKDQTVILTVTGKYGTAESSETFTVTVPAAQSADDDAVDAVMKTVNIPPEVVSNLTLPTSGTNDVTINWATSNSDVITKDGVVTRPAEGSGDVTVKLTATISKGDVNKTKEFDVLVRAKTSDTVKEAYNGTRCYYLTHKDLTDSYWQVFAAYAALGDYIQDPANGYTFYDVTKHKLGETWQGTDYGAVLLEIMAIGENPYNYKGINYVDLAVKNGTGGPYACPIWATMGLEGAGAQGYSPAVGYCVGQLSESAMQYGVDIAGWAVAELSRHIGEPGVDDAIANFTTLMKAHQSDQGYFDYHSMGSTMLSTGCVVSGFTALTAAGQPGYDVTKDPWLVNGVNMMESMYKDINKGNSSDAGLGTQVQIEFCDLYNTLNNNGDLAWFSVGVSKDKLDAQITKANAILADSDAYTADSITMLQSALEKVNAISSDRLNAKIPDFGKEYYDLFDAVRYAQTIDASTKDQEAADQVTSKINALPDAASVTLDDQAAVKAVRSAYDILTDDQKTLVADDTLTRLTGIESAISNLQTLADAKTTAKADLTTALSGYKETNYTVGNWTALNKAKTDGDAAIDSATSVDNVNKAKTDAIAAMAAVETAAKDSSFTDVGSDDWFFDDVAYVVENNIFYGTSSTTFGSDQKMTRAMMVTVLYRLSGETASSDENTFSDVEAGAYYAEAVAWATKANITAGTGNDKFSPEVTVTREEAMTFLYRYAQYINVALTGTPGKALEDFSDYSAISSWANAGMNWAYNAKIIQGASSTTLNPTGNTTRAQMAAFIHRFMEKTTK